MQRGNVLFCSECDKRLRINEYDGTLPMEFNYCPHCGHKFDFLGIASDIIFERAVEFNRKGDVMACINGIVIAEALDEIRRDL